MPTLIKCNDFVRRQTPSSHFSHYEGSETELISLVTAYFGEAKDGYKDGVLLVPVPPEGFWSSSARLADLPVGSRLVSRYEARRPGEDKVLVTVAKGRKVPAKAVFVVLYRRDVLGKEATTDAEWEIISVNARMQEAEEPIEPTTMARNFLEKAGGTKGNFTAQQFAESVWYWSQNILIEPEGE
jgi:hypothetical protein